MSVINVLPKHIADLIAAGEVVDRPASVVKETVENSIDAGAEKITVEIKHGGITYIRITDDGCGIMRDDVKNAFLSHATSKIKNENDLSSIGTLGFRGEALASVSAVSRVEVLTRNNGDNIGTHYVIEGGEEKIFEDAGCPCGTTMVIRDLFFNTPARMKFLKKDVSEANAVAGVVDRIALSHPEISIRFIRDGKETLLTPGDGKLLSAIYSVYGKNFAEGLLPVDYSLNGVRIDGFISKPINARANRSMQIFFINGRLVQTKTGSVALTEAYKNSIMVGKFPACALIIHIPNETVDVNVHPSKLEVRFANEKPIYDCIYYAVKNTISETDSRPQVDLSKIAVQPRFVQPEKFEQVKITESKPKTDFWQKQNSYDYKKEYDKTVKKDDGILKDSSPNYQTSQLNTAPEVNLPLSGIKIFEPKAEKNTSEFAESKPEKITDVTDSFTDEVKDEIVTDNNDIDIKIVGEAFKTYIFAECNGKLLIIDKHAAHERMIFEKLKKQESISERQILLSPVTVTFDKDGYNAIAENLDLLDEAGYGIEEFGTGSIIVRECPAVVSHEDIEGSIEEIAQYLKESRKDILTEKLDKIYHYTACRAAIKAGDKTSGYELELFVKNLLKDDKIRYCPHGRPVIAELTKREIEKFFGRIQ